MISTGMIAETRNVTTPHDMDEAEVVDRISDIKSEFGSRKQREIR